MYFLYEYVKIKKGVKHYFTSVTQKAHGTYKQVLEGTDVGYSGPTWYRRSRENH